MDCGEGDRSVCLDSWVNVWWGVASEGKDGLGGRDMDDAVGEMEREGKGKREGRMGEWWFAPHLQGRERNRTSTDIFALQGE